MLPNAIRAGALALAESTYNSRLSNQPHRIGRHTTMLTQDQIEAYNRDGYVRVKGLFSATESAELAANMVRIIEE